MLVYLNDVEMTSAGAGLGMDPYHVIIPTNRLVASCEPRTTPIARCECGTYGCGATDITITRHGDRVRWDWLIEVPMNRGVSFDAADYDREISRVAFDQSWENGRTADPHWTIRYSSTPRARADPRKAGCGCLCDADRAPGSVVACRRAFAQNDTARNRRQPVATSHAESAEIDVMARFTRTFAPGCPFGRYESVALMLTVM